jgi:hypothetical protein
MPRSLPSFDFDEWARLAQRDPAGFEARRRELLDAVIAEAPASRRQRLRRLQWRIDRERERCPNPLNACVRLSGWMWRSFAGDGGLAESLNRLRTSPPQRSRPPRRAQIIAFPSPHRPHPR